MMQRRDFLRLLSATFAAPLPVLRAAVDPLRAFPAAIANLSPLHLIGLRSPELRTPRWCDAKLLREPAESLEELTQAAKADGIDVWARSGHRTLFQQRYLWNAKYRGHEDVRWIDGSRETLDTAMTAEERVRRILAYTAFPGTSRHHWGTDVDIAQAYSDRCADYLLSRSASGDDAAGGAGEPAGGESAPEGATGPADDDPWAEAEAECLPLQQWLAARAQEFGWCPVYDAVRGGFQPEPWHWSYLPFAVPALARYVAEVTPDLLRDRNIDADLVVLDDFAAYRDKFLLGVHPSALPDAAPAPDPDPAAPPADMPSRE
jgi:LAS superfamily LD-carboxypeptidase LdcB